MSRTWWSVLDSPLGELRLESDGTALTALRWPGSPPLDPSSSARRDDLPVFAAARAQLDAYFAGDGIGFDLALAAGGTPFQLRVWSELRRIPRGRTISYAELARRVGSPRAHRAVGAANGRNPLSIIVPCHRVVGADGRLTGFAGGLAAKEWLLRLEQALPAAGA